MGGESWGLDTTPAEKVSRAPSPPPPPLTQNVEGALPKGIPDLVKMLA